MIVCDLEILLSMLEYLRVKFGGDAVVVIVGDAGFGVVAAV